MISSEEIKQKAGEFGINPTDVEKDYVYGWILNELYLNSVLGNQLVLKGGNGCRKAYLPNTRFSKDLDFSIQHDAIDMGLLHDEINKVCASVEEKTGIVFELNKTIVKPKNVPIPDLNALEGRAYFKGFFGEENITLKAQLDVTQFDQIYLGVHERQLIHPYSDSAELKSAVKCQKLEEIIASKLTTLLHRRKAVDLFDLTYSTLFNSDYAISRSEVISTFIKKSIFESNPSVAKQQLLSIPLEEFRSLWSTIVMPIKNVLSFDSVIGSFGGLLDDLFGLIPVLAPATVFGGGPRSFGGMSYFPSNDRNTIINAGRTNTMVEMSYDGYRRLVEPYSFEYLVRKKDNRGMEYFWGFDTTGGKSNKTSIKRFICDKIEYVVPTTRPFNPQWPIEL